MKRKKKDTNAGKYIAIVVVVLAMVFSFNAVIIAQGEKSEVVELTDLATALGGDSGAFVEGLNFLSESIASSFGAIGTRFPSGISVGTTTAITTAGDTLVGGPLIISGTTTLGLVTYDEKFFVALSFTAGNTTTPGALASLPNTDAPRICTDVQLELTNNIDGAFVFSITTSTSATTHSGSGGGLIASTTYPTSTSGIINNTDQVGSAAQTSWSWGSNVFVNAQFDVTDALGVNSTTDYVDTTGGLYISCITR